MKNQFNKRSSQKGHLLHHLQTRLSITTDELRRKGVVGSDGSRHILGNAWQVIKDLREEGWVIVTETYEVITRNSTNTYSKYVYKGYIEDFSEEEQQAFIRMKAVKPSLFDRLDSSS